MPTDTPPETCPSCQDGILVRIEPRPDGSTKHYSCGHKHHDIHLEDKLEFHGSLGFKAKRQGKGKPHVEGKTGEELHCKSGKWMRKERLVDREKDQYREVVTDPETGKVVHRCEEPLSQHRGHGSAKDKKKPKSE